MESKRYLAVFCGLILLVSGCGVKFWYNQLDWLVPWYLDDYIELNDKQQQQLQQLLNTKVKWHRGKQLPLYVTWLEQLRSDLKSGAIQQTYDAHSQQLTEFYQALLEELAGDVAEIMIELDPNQVQELLANLQRNDREWAQRNDERNNDQRIEYRQQRIEDNLSDWIGKLSKSQKRLIAEWASQHKPTSVERLAYRKRWREALEAQLSQQYSPQKLADLEQVFINYRSYQGAPLVQLTEHNKQLTKRYLLTIYASLSERQQKRLLNKIADYHEDFSDLASN